MKKKLLITGAYGLVGSAICRILEERHPDIEVIKYKCTEFYREGNDEIEIDHTEGELNNIDYVIHAAGYGQPIMFGKDKVNTLNINTFYTEILLRRILKPLGTFLFISTSELYSGAPSPHTEEMIGTTTPQHPRACYIEGKRCGEAICMAYKEQGYDVKIARLALAYGPGTKKGDTRVLNQFIEQALTMGRIVLMDDGSAKRTYCYVDDAAEMILDILFEGKDTVYNVGGISETSIKELADLIGLMTMVEVIPGHKPLDGAPDSVKLDITKVTTEFPRDFVKMYDGINNTIEYQKKLYAKD